ncbi:MAG: flagellar motor protein [Dehalococcoidia bacterium]|nr:flagellar motor protein [Dehalococcoidia bacterium]MCA9845717.1 flagellar motor protein [Dehalococcoidia bacterium]MCA9854525.1 flagellar motor protein [Dehalococcoidia bacterium]
MDLATIIGLVLALVGIIGGMVLEGGNPAALFNIPGLMIVVVGTLGAVMISQSMDTLTSVPGALVTAFTGGKSHDAAKTVDHLVDMADKSRREGLLALEAEVGEIEDRFMKKGVQLMIDGTDPELLREIMEIDAASMKHRHESRFAVLEFMGGIAPTIGVLGAVMGLMSVMTHLDEPDHIGPGIATAFVATFYGVFTANVLFLPLAKKLQGASKHEIAYLEMVIEGLMSIQAGDNPRIVREKLDGFLTPSERKREKDDGDMAEAA